MVRARKYHAKVALHITPNEDPRISILEEKFTGRDTWAAREYRKPQVEIDKRLRTKATEEILEIATIGKNPFYTRGKDSFLMEVIPQDFEGIMLFELLRYSNNAKGRRGGYSEINRASYLPPNENIGHIKEQLSIMREAL